MSKTTLISDYKLKSNSGNNITLKMLIGYGQLGETTVSIDGVPVFTDAKNQQNDVVHPDANGEYPGSFTLIIGTNASLKDKHLLIVCSVERIQDDDNTSVDIELLGGQLSNTYPTLKEKIDKKNDWLTYVAFITFTL